LKDETLFGEYERKTWRRGGSAGSIKYFIDFGRKEKNVRKIRYLFCFKVEVLYAAIILPCGCNL
jgi:hypothetical protein